MSRCVDLTIQQGETLSRTLRYASQPFIWKPVTAITKAAPARLTVPGHALPAGWPVWVESVQGMRQINASKPPAECDLHQVTVVDADTIELNDVNSLEFDAYRSGGTIKTYTPVSLAGASASLVVKNKPGGTVLLTLDTATHGGVVLDDTAKTIAYTFEAADTLDYTWLTGVYEFKIQFASGKVKDLQAGSIRLELAR